MKKPLYHYGRHLNRWVIWDKDGVKAGDFITQEEAAAETYRLNGWGLKRKDKAATTISRISPE